MRHAANENWSTTHLESVLANSEFPEPHVDIFSAFWRGEHEKMHDALVRESRWTHSCDPVKWRVDLCVASKGTQRQLNEPTALVELACRPAAFVAAGEQPTTLRFEMNKAKLSEVNAKFA